MRLGTVTSAPAVRIAPRLDGADPVTPVRRITPEWIDEDPLDELTQSDRALLGHLYGQGEARRRPPRSPRWPARSTANAPAAWSPTAAT